MIQSTIASITVLAITLIAFGDDKKPAKDELKWKPLFDGKTLDGWKLSYTDGSGKVAVKDGAIVLPAGQKMTGITYDKKDFPKTDYEVTLEAKRVEGSDFFCTTTFPVGDSFCSLVVGGWGGRVTGISSINGSDASENETTGSMDFKNGEWYLVRIRVTTKKVEAWIGKEQVVDLEPKSRKLSTRIECEECQPFGICTWDTAAAVRDIKVRALSDEKASAKK